ncbi:MAG TPA: ABC transporter ATP-binding protein [Euzebyales bacterium]
MAAIEVDGLRKTYGSVRAVDGLSFTVARGEVFALLGPNGAGKTTTVEILEGHRSRDSGTVSVLGFDPEDGGGAYRERIGIVLQEAALDEEFSVRELARLYAGFFPAPRSVDEVIGLVGLTDKADVRIGTLSGGQRRRADLALGLIGDPELLYLDEPTTGFDPSARHAAWEMLEGLRELGKTILLTTHYMDEAEHLADRVAMIAAGRLVALGTPDELAEQQMASTTVITFVAPDEYGSLPALHGRAQRDGHRVEVRTSAPTDDLHELTAWALARGVELRSLRLARPTLEQVYLDVVGRAERERADV